MRAQFTLKQETMDALALRAEYAEITVSRLVEYVLSQWLLKNEAVVLLTGDARPSVNAPPVNQPSITPASKWDPNNRPPFCKLCGTEDNGTNFKDGVHVVNCPARSQKPASFKERFGKDAKVTREHGDPMCMECGNLLPEDQIGLEDTHPSCLGYSPSSVNG